MCAEPGCSQGQVKLGRVRGTPWTSTPLTSDENRLPSVATLSCGKKRLMSAAAPAAKDNTTIGPGIFFEIRGQKIRSKSVATPNAHSVHERLWRESTIARTRSKKVSGACAKVSPKKSLN